MTRSTRFVFAGLAMFAACMGEKPNGLRADGATGSSGARVAIAGLTGDTVSGRLHSVSGGKRSNGQAYAQFILAKSDGSRQNITVEPWPLDLPQCTNAECAAEAERLQMPDGIENRLTIARKGKVVAMAVSQSRLRTLPGGVAFKLLLPSERKSPGGRIGIDLRAGETLLERGKTANLQLAGRQCTIHLFDATIAADARPGIAEESPAFTADWVLVCK